MRVDIHDGYLLIDDEAVLEGLPADGWTAEADPEGRAVFLIQRTPRPAALVRTRLGRVVAARRATALHRYEPFWCRPTMLEDLDQTPPETQALLVDLYGEPHVLVVPLYGEARRASLQGTPEGLIVLGESNDPWAAAGDELAVMVAVGKDPYELMERAAAAVADRVGAVRREAKPLPDFVDQFGWCTWDAFYQDVDADKVRLGLESFREGGIAPGLLILDDGWQSERTFPDGTRRLTAFAPNAKFGGDLGPTVRMAKDEFGVRTFLVWHAFHGYWSGVDGEAMPGYGVAEMRRSYGPPMHAADPNVDWMWWGNLVGVVAPDRIGAFFDDYHATLAAQGVDGVKVDNQGMAESLVAGLGGRVAVTRAYRDGLEASVRRHFAGRLINCMSNANETHLMARDSTVTRTSTDFWPNKPESHGDHLQCNAHMGLWFGQFVHPDWDMFQSGHPMGAYHAAGRAVSSSPVYVSDKPEGHDFEILRRLVLSDGTVARTDRPALPTPDCLFVDATREAVPLKIWSTCGNVGVVAAFHAAYRAPAPGQADGGDLAAEFASGDVGPADVPGLVGGRFAAWSFGTGLLGVYDRADRIQLDLGPAEWEVFAFAPVVDGFAPIGLVQLLNAPGAVRQTTREPDGWTVALRDGGRFLAYLASAPREVQADGAAVPFAYDADAGALTVDLPAAGSTTLRILV